jgi:hypothetical protein
MKKPPGKKKTAPTKRVAQKKRAAAKKPGPSKKENSKKEPAAERAARTAAAVKKKKITARPAARSAEKTGKPSRTKKPGKEPLKTGRKTSAAETTAPKAAAAEKALARTAAKTIRKKPGKKAEAAVPAAAKRRSGKTAPGAAGGKTSRAGTVEISRVAPPRRLPEEYGDNEVILMPVDPNVIFVDWEIKKEEMPADDAPVTMRVFGTAAGHTISEWPPGRFLELRLERRTGSGFFDIGMPGSDVAVEIGLHRNGIFSPVVKSPKVSMPEPVVLDELGIAQKLFESGVPVGY